jgi:hypothetical protein
MPKKRIESPGIGAQAVQIKVPTALQEETRYFTLKEGIEPAEPFQQIGADLPIEEIISVR